VRPDRWQHPTRCRDYPRSKEGKTDGGIPPSFDHEGLQPPLRTIPQQRDCNWFAADFYRRSAKVIPMEQIYVPSTRDHP